MLTVKQFLACICVATLQFTDATRFCDFHDPCTSVISYLPNPDRRTDNCEYKQDQKCDDLISSTWYKTEQPMLDYCPGMSCCGALYPIWLNGNLPSVSEGAVERTACLVGSSCCDRTYTIKIKNCTSFQAYCLRSTTGCPERYCFGQNGTCQDPTTTSTTTLSSTQTVDLDTQSPDYNRDNTVCVSPESTAAIAISTMAFGAFVMFVACFIHRHRNYTNQVKDDDCFNGKMEKRNITNSHVSKGQKDATVHVNEQPPEYREKADHVITYTYRPDEGCRYT